MFTYREGERERENQNHADMQFVYIIYRIYTDVNVNRFIGDMI